MPPTSYYHRSRDRSVYSKNFKQLLDHFIVVVVAVAVVVVVVVVVLSNAMFPTIDFHLLKRRDLLTVAVDIVLITSPVLYVKL